MTLIVKHVGKIGDIVYSMAALRGHFLETGEKSHVLLLPHWGRYFDFNEDEIEYIRPLLEDQDYISKVDQSDDYSFAGGIDFRSWFFSCRDMKTNIAASMCKFLHVPDKYARQPWLKPYGQGSSGDVIVNWTGRYPANDAARLWSGIVSATPPKAFLGHKREAEAFKKLTGVDLPVLPIANAVDAAKAIAGCARLLCNQSSSLAIANGLGVPVTVEVSQDYPDCIFRRPGAFYPGVPDAVQINRGIEWV